MRLPCIRKASIKRLRFLPVFEGILIFSVAVVLAVELAFAEFTFTMISTWGECKGFLDKLRKPSSFPHREAPLTTNSITQVTDVRLI